MGQIPGVQVQPLPPPAVFSGCPDNLNTRLSFCEDRLLAPVGGGGGDSNIKKVGMLVENFEINP